MIPRLFLSIFINAFTLVTSKAQTMTDKALDEKANNIIHQMTLKEKVFEMHGHGVARFGLSVVFTKKLHPVKAGGNKKFGIPPTTFIDGPRGLFHYHGATAFPVTMARGASWDVDLEKRVGEAMGEEIRAVGGNYSGAVCMNLLRHPAWGRAQETYGEDPYHVGEMASALVQGIQSHNVQACVKHFAANSMENNRFGGSMNMDERTLHEVYLPHFKKAIQRGAASVMSAYNKLNGEYCGHNKTLLTDILRNDWGFKGYITSDWMYGLRDAQKGIEAGMNIEMPVPQHYNLKNIKKLIKAGKITERQIDELIFPVIRTKLLFANRADKQIYPHTLIGNKEHIALAREAAEKSAVLLKNENHLLPFSKAKIKRIAVVGSLASVKQTGDHGSSSMFPSYIVSPIEGVRNYLKGTSVELLTCSNADLEQVKKICTDADVVLVVAGTTYKDEGEFIGDGAIRNKNNPDKKSFITRTGILAVGGDRKYLHLHPADIDVIKTAASVNKNTIVSLVAGSAVTVEEWQAQVPAILETFYNGMEGGNALASILFGDVNPSGKLPFTVPKLESDLPPFNSFDENVTYGYYHGYTLFNKNKTIPRYAFGYGLSYTTFLISDVKLHSTQISKNDSVQVSVKLKNTGDKAGAEVVQLYIGFASSKFEMPEKLLRGFNKVFLQPGQEQTISFTIPASGLAYFNPEKHAWEIEPGTYQILVGNSSETAHNLKAEFTFR